MSHAPRSRAVADWVLVGITTFWGVAFPVVGWTLGHVDPFTFLALRFGVAATALVPLARRRLFDRETLKLGLILGVVLFGSFVFQTVGQLYTTPARSAFITGLCVVLTPLISAVAFRRLPKPAVLIGILLATAGLYRLTSEGLSQGGGTLRGDLLTLACALLVATHIVLNGIFSRRAPAIPLVAVQLLFACAAASACLPWVETRWHFSGWVWVAIAYCGLFATALAIGLQTWAQARTSAVRAALIFSLEPVFGAFSSAAAGMERLGVAELQGGGLILLGVVIAEVGGHWLETLYAR